jgi:prolyl-tRNA editing enzyme YbaK/EbsC (Cys-tRNA(Pro) deacylase)
MVNYLALIGGVSPGGAPDELRQLVDDELKRWREVITNAHVVVQ